MCSMRKIATAVERVAESSEKSREVVRKAG
jgi:hypothetical protein